MLNDPATQKDSVYMVNHRRIGILVTNTDRSDFARSHDDDGVKFTALMQSARPDWSYRAYDCTIGQFPETVDQCDGYIIGGSPASVNDDAAWIGTLCAFIRKFDSVKTPVVGCCFGHQAIAKALGGTVGKNPGGWGFGVAATRMQRTEAWMTPAKSAIQLYAAHSEQVTKLPQQAIVLGGDAFCPAGSFRIGDHFLTTQYHPEMTKDFFVALTHAFETYIGSEVAENAREQAQTETDDKVFAQWMANFLEGRQA
jgi:GMP synthase-like glutamine amidotransferase